MTEVCKKIWIWLVMLIFIVLFVLFVVFHIQVGAIDKESKMGKHGYIMLVSFCVLNLGVMVHQAFGNMSAVNSVHLFIQIFGALIFLIGVVTAFVVTEESFGGEHISYRVHLIGGIVMLCFIIIHKICAILYYREDDDNEMRTSYFKYHPCVGVFLIMFFLATYLTGIYFQMEMELVSIAIILMEISYYHMVIGVVIFLLFPLLILQHYKEEVKPELSE